MQISNLPFAPGDATSLLICATSPTDAYFSFTNLTSLQYAVFSITAPEGTTLVGNCAEAVMERPTIGVPPKDVLQQLPRYGESFFDETFAYTKSGVGFGVGIGTPISMLADDGVTIISSPEFVDSDAIRIHYTGP